MSVAPVKRQVEARGVTQAEQPSAANLRVNRSPRQMRKQSASPTLTAASQFPPRLVKVKRCRDLHTIDSGRRSNDNCNTAFIHRTIPRLTDSSLLAEMSTVRLQTDSCNCSGHRSRAPKRRYRHLSQCPVATRSEPDLDHIELPVLKGHRSPPYALHWPAIRTIHPDCARDMRFYVAVPTGRKTYSAAPYVHPSRQPQTD